MLIGYARVSTDEQKLDLQLDALNGAGCAKVFSDTLSGARDDRPGLARAIGMLDAGDVLVVWKLDRLGRSLPHLVSVVGDLQARGIEFRSLQESIDTTTPGGRLVFHVFAALAQFERELVRERTKAGLQAARARGRRGGRKHKLDAAQRNTLLAMAGQKIPIEQICASLSISEATYFRCLRAARGAAQGTLATFALTALSAVDF
jgi:DNA invertase Pin-like site-specific DNA recombinase